MTRSDNGKKFFRVDRMKTETKVLQKDIRKQQEWAVKWQVKFSIDFYKIKTHSDRTLSSGRKTLLVTATRG